jgi:DNA-binding IclR family transcriptional regulator
MGDVPQSYRAQDTPAPPPAASPPDSTAYAGAQSISRAFQLFRVVAKAGEAGVRLRDAAAAVQLNSSTAHRLLMALVTERVVVRDPVHRRYRVGTEFLRLLEGVRSADLSQRYGEVIRYVAAKTGESTYLSVPDGTDVVCIARVLGASVIQPIPFDIGGRRPFGVGAAGIVALAAMPEQRIPSILAQHAPVFESYGLTSAEIGRLVQECRRTGYCYNPGLFIRGVSGVGVPINNANGQLDGILNIVALDERLQSEVQRLQIVSLLRDAIRRTGEPPITDSIDA